ncbi:unnamed protein product [Durusdinium trenchii]|uniref:Uncharacterized protein n=2 Tax=Durusdinium trenchii TaxID=1381693 RepID=A0ABP0S8P7_9DINO
MQKREMRLTDPAKFKLLQGGESRADQPIIQLPGLVPPLTDDTGECTMVLVFPRDRRAGGAVDHHEFVAEPFEKAKDIFDVGDNPASADTLKKFQYIVEDADDDLEMELYQADIRSRFLEILGHSGIMVEQFSSLDGDEDFVTLTLPLEGPTIEYFAQRLGYSMPLTSACYQKVKPHGPYPGTYPMSNDDGREVVAYDRFTQEGKERFQKFRKTDAIRILEFWLDRWVSLDEMQQQGVISKYYPCPDPEELEAIHNSVLTCKGFIPENMLKGIISFRTYFGDQIAFLFRWNLHLCNATTILAIVGVIFFALKMTTLSPDETEIGKTCIALFLSIWVAGMLQVFKRHTARLKQIWGIKSEEEIIVQVHADWDHERVGVPGWVVNLFTVLFLACYMGGIFGVLAWQYSLEEDSFFYSYSSVILTVVIKGGSFIWGLLAPCLVGLENIRKESAFTDKLSGLLAGVKLFVANWPFIAHAFLTNYLQRTCGASHEEAAGKVYPDFDPAHDNGAILKVLKEQWAYKRGHQVCLPGCMPESWRSMATQYTTSCEADLESNLTTYFFFAIVIEFVFLVLPIALSYLEIWKEYKKMQTVDPEEGGPTYKFLEWEAKKFPYEFNSWGGDKINDYLDSAISYSVIACWGSIAPIMFVFGCISFYASYRLRTYRMLYVTQRPLPRVACGLGVWASIFSAINASAVATNVGLACFFFYPGVHLHLWQKLALFLALEHVVLVLQSTVQFLVSDNPKDVEEIGFYNEHASSLLRNDASTHHAQVRATKCDHLNLSTNPDGLESTDAESD